MYNFPSNSPEDSCWLQATAQRYHARRLDDGPDRRSWPYGQVLGPDSSSQPRSAHSLHHHTVATAQPDHAHWPSFSLRPRPEGYLSSSTDSCQSVNFASCQPTVLSPIRATNFQSYACSPQWQSPNQYRTFPVSAQCSASVHNESVHNVIPNPFQGKALIQSDHSLIHRQDDTSTLPFTVKPDANDVAHPGSLHSVQNHDHPRADFFAADLLSKDGLSMTNFTAVQVPPDTPCIAHAGVFVICHTGHSVQM